MDKIQTVLLIDDMEIEHVNVRYILEDYDESIKLLSAYDGKEGLELLLSLENQPDVVLLDINMPCMNGHEFLIELGKTRLRDTVVVVMLTSSDQDLDKKMASQHSNVKGYIGKPLEEENLEYITRLIKSQ